MFNLGTYIATKEDLEAIGEGIKYVWHPKLEFIFSDKSKIAKTAVISYDSGFVYIWRNEKFNQVPHKLKINKNFHSYWRGDLEPREIEQYLPDSIHKKTRFEVPIISGGLLKPFIELQKQKKRPNNPYVTRESYLATIVHEFGHIYYGQHKLWWFSNKEENLALLRAALKLYSGYKIQRPKIPRVNLPNPVNFTEIFASCTEYCAADLFWSLHKKALELDFKERIKKIIQKEKNINLEKKNSNIELTTYETAHTAAAVIGSLILETYPQNWPEKLLTRLSL